ncbi:MAG TPA: FtsQ-type POTRA domain-containing protein [Anaerolineales bacterium]|nr:FtsQ-type POTRA domain-containing protein [Anaerolineales bacterium]
MSEKKDLARADLVRLRREQDSKTRVQRARKDATRSVPVTSRKQDAVPSRRRSAQESASRRARRRFQNALLPVAPDAEMRGISISRPNLGKRLPSFLLVLLLASALYFAFNAPQLQVIQAQVVGNQMLTAAEINTALNIAGQPAFLLIPSELEKRLRLQFPELAAAKVDIALPNTVLVQVIERKPVVRWEQGEGYTWISEEGIAFRPHGDMPGLIGVVALSAPPIEGIISSDPLTPAPFLKPDLVKTLKGLAGHVPPGAQILYDASFGFGWNDPRGWQVYFGTSASDVELKMRVYESLVESLTGRGIQPAMINVTYPTAPYYRLSE